LPPLNVRSAVTTNAARRDGGTVEIYSHITLKHGIALKKGETTFVLAYAEISSLQIFQRQNDTFMANFGKLTPTYFTRNHVSLADDKLAMITTLTNIQLL